MSGVVIIADGSHTRVLTLSPHELRNGGIVYRPHAEEINVELEVIAPEGISASQSIRIVAESAFTSGSAPVSAAATQIVSRVLAPRPAVKSERRNTEAAHFQPPPPSSVQLKQRSITITDAPAIDHVDLARAAAIETALTLLPPSPPLPALPVTLPPPVVSRVESAPLRPVPQPDATLIDPAVPARPFRPATPIHAPQPRMPHDMDLPQYAFDHLAVKVQLSIDAEGRVARAQAVDTVGAYAGRLVASTLNTARQWTFHPAMLGEEPVESTMEVTFRYSRSEK
jgi:hypothetical protein